MTFHHTYPVQLRFSDVDQLGHVNNSVYFSSTTWPRRLSLCCPRRRNELPSLVACHRNINANFFVPVFFTDQIAVETATIHLGHKSFTLLQRAVCAVTGEVKCECRTVMVPMMSRHSSRSPSPGSGARPWPASRNGTVEELEAGR